MAFDQNITYRVNVDDTDFQAKLSQLRASLDMTMGGSTFAGGMGMGGIGFGGGMMGPLSFFGGGTQQGYYGTPSMGGMGLADFGAQIKPITYTPPAIAMQPHFGMISLQQTTGQAAAGMFGMAGAGAYTMAPAIAGLGAGAIIGGMLGGPLGAVGGAAIGGIGGFMRSPGGTGIPNNISVAEYTALSTRAMGNRLGDAAATAGLVTAGTAAGMVGSGLGAAGAEALFGGGMVAGLAGGLLGGAVVSAGVSATGEMMANNRAVQTQLEAGSFRFITGGADADPLTGRGFSRAARARVADFIQTQELKDLRFGMPEMREILESGMQQNMFAGTQDVETFKTRFKGLVETMKTITSTLHTSIQEGMGVMRGMQDIGITDPGQMTNMALRAETLGRMSGRTGMEMLALGQTGAEIFRGTGISMQLGANVNMQNVAMVKQMLQMGAITQDTVAQAGGENALAQQLTASALGATQSAVGRGAMLGMFNPATGGLDFSMRGGTFGVLGRAAAKTPEQILDFQARQEEIVSKMSPQQLQMFGMQVDLMQAATVTDAFMGGSRRGTPDYQRALENNFINMEKRRGVPIAAIRANVGMLHTDPAVLQENQENAMASMAQQAAMEDLRNNFNITKAASNFIRGNLIQPVQRFFTGIGTEVGTAVDRLGMAAMGATVANPLGMTKESVARGAALQGPGLAPSVVDASGNFMQRSHLFGLVNLTGGGQSGEDLASAMQRFGGDNLNYQGMTGQRFSSVDDVKKFAAAHGSMTILTQTAKGGAPVIAVPTDQLNKAQEQQDKTMPTADDLSRANDTKMTTQQIAAIERIKVRQSELGKEAGFQTIGRALFGEKFMTDASTAGFQRAMAKKVAEEEGFTQATAEEKASGKGFAGTKIRGAAKIMEQAHASLKEAVGVLGQAGGVRTTFALADMTEEQQLLTAQMAAAGTDEQKMVLRHQLGKTGISEKELEMLDKNITLKGDQKAQLQDKLNNIDASNFAADEERKRGMGFSGMMDKMKGLFTGGDAVSGQANPDQTRSVNDLANQTLETVKMIAELQKYVKDNMPRR
jgi:hypothetical protein